jgi:purine-cytosine permease-like protein
MLQKGKRSARGRCRSLIAIIAAVLVASILHDKNLEWVRLVQVIFVIWVVLVSADNFYTHHADKYAHYYIDSNMRRIRRALGLKKTKKLEAVLNGAPLTARCHNFQI